MTYQQEADEIHDALTGLWDAWLAFVEPVAVPILRFLTKLRRERYDFDGALAALVAEFPGSRSFISDMQMYSAIGKDRRKLRFRRHAEPVVRELRAHCTRFAALDSPREQFWPEDD